MLRDQETLIDIIESCRLILEYTQGIDWESLCQNREKQDAILRRITIIGEAYMMASPENELELSIPKISSSLKRR